MNIYRPLLLSIACVSSIISSNIQSMLKNNYCKRYTTLQFFSAKNSKTPKKLTFLKRECKKILIMQNLLDLTKADLPTTNPNLSLEECGIEPVDPEIMLRKYFVNLDKEKLEARIVWLKYFIEYETDSSIRRWLIELNKLAEEALEKNSFKLKEIE